MITTIILDIGNVLADFRWREYLRECNYEEETVDKIAKATVLSEYWGEVDRGRLSEEEIMKLCCEQDSEVADKIKDFFANLTELVREYPYAEQFIKDLKEKGYKVYLLSNYGRRTFQYAKENFKFIPQADGGVISYEVKAIKPEPAIYEALLNKYKIKPEEAVFLDDVQANLSGARAFGINTILVKDFSQALSDLRDMGVNI